MSMVVCLMAEREQQGNIVADTDNVLQTVFIYINKNSLKNCHQLLVIFFRSNKQCSACILFCYCDTTGTHAHWIYSQHSFSFWGLQGSVTDVVGKYGLRSKDGTAEEVGTNDKRVLIQQNGLPSVYKGSQSFLKATLQYMHGSAFLFHFRNSTRSEMMKKFVTSKIINNINDNASC